MDFIEQLRKRAKKKGKHIVFPEATDHRVLRAASFLQINKICRPGLIGNPRKIRRQADGLEFDLSDIEIVQPGVDKIHEEFAEKFFKKRKKRDMTRKKAKQLLMNPQYFGAAMAAFRSADGAVSGSTAPTSEVLRAALQVIGPRKDTSIVSSIFLMVMPDGRVVTYGDCGVVPYPDVGQLSDIAVESARSHRLLTGQEPVVAMLSFSTKGSAEHESVSKVREALELARAKAPDLKIDGELQFDAAYLPEVARRKASASEVAGKANVFIFPNLDAGNIAYKITERLGGASATGPILQGLARPMMDLSRGCGWEDIVNAACVAVLMGEG